MLKFKKDFYRQDLYVKIEHTRLVCKILVYTDTFNSKIEHQKLIRLKTTNIIGKNYFQSNILLPMLGFIVLNNTKKHTILNK